MAGIGENLRDVSGLAGYAAKHWSGGFSLGFAYWINGALLGAVLFVAAYLAGYAIAAHAERIGPVVGRFAIGAIVLGSVAATVWQLTGIWRSAARHVSRGGRRVWAVLAQVAVVLGAVRAVAELVREAPTFALLFGV